LKIINYFVFALAALIILSISNGCGSSKSDINTEDPQKAFDIAKRKFDKADYVDAIEDFSFIKIRFPGTEVSDKVQYYLALSYFYQKEYLLAAYEFDNFLKNYPLSPLYPEGKFMLANTYYELSPKYSLDQEFTKEALNEFLSFVELYPQDKNVASAEAKIKELRNKLAYKDYWTAELYMKTDNYKAASLYYQNVYDTYIDSDWADDAMVGQADAYINGRKYEEAKKVLDKFYKLFPKSDQKTKADRLKSRIAELQTSK
jgi:outer membrane protein assembly factor BamD